MLRRWARRALAGFVIALAAGGCERSSSAPHHRPPSLPEGATHHHHAPAHRRHRAPAHRQPSSSPASAGTPGICPPPGRTLVGVYHPSRLAVRDPCRRVTGVVTSVTPEEDGDVHFDVRLDPRFHGMLMAANRTEQHGDLVVELMPRDRGHIPAPPVYARVSVTGAYVDDTDHAWAEIHPVWGLRVEGGPLDTSGPRFGGSPPRARSDDAIKTCRTAGGKRCEGYGGTPSAATGRSRGNRSPGDRDCTDFSTQAQAQRWFLAHGGPERDPSGLDADHDGQACEDLPG